MIGIDKDIPIPTDDRRNGTSSKYPFKSMNIGESFFVAGKKIQNIGYAVTRAKKMYGNDYTARTVIGGVRVWRIK
jgi:hypothetical protein